MPTGEHHKKGMRGHDTNFDKGKKNKKIPLPVAKTAKNPNPGGRPPKITKELIEEWKRLVVTCYYVETVANMLDIDRTTTRIWRARGRKEYLRLLNDDKAKPLKSEELYYQFFIAVKRSMAECENFHATKITADASWQSSAWLLERRHAERYGSQTREIKALEREIKELNKKLEDALKAQNGAG